MKVIRLGTSPSVRGWRDGYGGRGGRGWSWRGSDSAVGRGWHTAADFLHQPGWSCPEQPAFLFEGCSLGELSRSSGRLGLEMPCLQPAIMAVAGESTFFEFQATCSGWSCATCIACECREYRREAPEIAGARPRP